MGNNHFFLKFSPLNHQGIFLWFVGLNQCRFTISVLVWAALCYSGLPIHGADMPLEIQVYATAHQVDEYLSTPEGRSKVLEQMKVYHAGKLYLEAVRSGHKPSAETMRQSRDFFRSHGMQVSVGVATVPGGDFGIPSTNSRYSINYQAEETRKDLEELFSFCAAEFEEIMVDDFLMTDDESDMSLNARGSRSWPEYRLQLMTDVARDHMIAPARAKRRDVSVIIKYPQWYDRFHVFGYNVETGPQLFDQVWVGTETRDPETERFGYVQPTEGFINYSWLQSLSGNKIGGAWFDHLDCPETIFLMQAYQSVLAGARKLTLFNLGDLMENNPVAALFLSRFERVTALAEALGQDLPQGWVALKPPHSEPGYDLYLFDYLTMLGFPLRMSGTIPSAPEVLILSTHSAQSGELRDRLMDGSLKGCKFLLTPGFLSKIEDAEIKKAFGLNPAACRSLEVIEAGQIVVNGKQVALSESSPFFDLPVVASATQSAYFSHEGRKIPIMQHLKAPAGDVYILNIHTFGEDLFGPDKELFLAPTKLQIPHWPQELADLIRSTLGTGPERNLTAKPPFGLYLYSGQRGVVTNFTDKPLQVSLPGPHGDTQQVTVPGWEYALVNFERNKP